MYWKLILDQNSGTLELWDRELVAKQSWEEKRNTGQDVLVALNQIKEDQSIEWNDVPEFQLDLDLPPHATARRIAETFRNTYNAFVAS